MDRNLQPTIMAMAEARAIFKINEAVSGAVKRQLAEENLHYQNLVGIHKDNNGRVVMMQANTVQINQVAADITLAVNETLEQIKDQKLNISLGQAVGSHFLANYGPDVNVSILPVGSVKVLVADEFDAVGINQVRHRLALDINTKIKVAVPFYTNNVTVHTVIPLTENIIVGEVPETWVSIPGGLFGKSSLGETILGGCSKSPCEIPGEFLR
ncbi:MAG: sporulation protein YunB [Desulfotomaculum sp.]|nr:sporulation protein YunB [Desulfotomaculum sp.]